MKRDLQVGMQIIKRKKNDKRNKSAVKKTG